MAFWHFCLSICQNKLFSLNESETGGTGATGGGSCVHGARQRSGTERPEGRQSEWRMSLCETGNPAKTETTASSCFSYANIELRIYVHINIQTYIWTYLCRYICEYCCLIPKSCPILCDPIHCNPPGSSVHSVFQARILEWVVISFSRGSNLHLLHWQVASLPLSHQGSSCKECMLSSFSRVQLFATPWTVAHQASLSMGFFRQESWSG